MDIGTIFSFLLHLDKYIGIFITSYGAITYLILFAIIFLETGIVFFPFLPGDSLIFGAAVFASQNLLNIITLLIIFILAAILGDTFNYWIGYYIGRKILRKKWISEGAIEKTNRYYNKYGDKTIIYARFVPIIRTLAPFFAGMGRMEYRNFLRYNIVGAISWILVYLIPGFLLGKIPIIHRYIAIVTLILVIVTLIPPIIQAIKIIKQELIEKRIKQLISKTKPSESSIENMLD